MILCDNQIEDLCLSEETPMISPFQGKLVRAINDQRVVSYGLSSFGYDLRLGNEFKAYKSAYSVDQNKADWSLEIDPLNFNTDKLLETFYVNDNDYALIPPHGYLLAHAKEHIRMPRNVSALCIGKSTYARAGIFVNTTPIEACWEGIITLEIANLTPRPARIYAGQGICQLQFFRGEQPSVSYSDRGGKYQNQTGVTPPRT